MSERVDVLAVIDSEIESVAKLYRAAINSPKIVPIAYRLQALNDTRAAVAELVEADRELDSAWDAYGDLNRDELDSQDAIDAALARIDLAESRRATALARFGGAS